MLDSNGTYKMISHTDIKRIHLYSLGDLYLETYIQIHCNISFL